MRVLILANNTEGLLSFRRELLEELRGGHEVTVSAPEPSEELSVREVCTLGARYVQTRHLSRRGTDPAEDLKLLWFYRSLIQSERPDVVLTYTIKPNAYGGMACQMECVSYIANVTGLGTSIQDGGVLARIALSLYRQGLRGANMTFFQNDGIRDAMIVNRILRGPYEVLPGSGVNTKRFQPAEYPTEEEGVVFLTVGRIMRAKGTLELIEAACEIKVQHPETRFVLVGSFDEDLEDIVSYAHDAGVIEYVPAQPDVRSYYAHAHALVHPSYHEGMSNVCLEAAAMGRPILASNVAGCKETFDEGVSGFGFEPQNAGSLIDAIERFLALSWEEKRAMGLAGREKVVREFDRQIVVDAYMQEIERAFNSTHD